VAKLEAAARLLAKESTDDYDDIALAVGIAAVLEEVDDDDTDWWPEVSRRWLDIL